MRAQLLVAGLLTTAAACSGGDAGGEATVVRDSAGVSITEHSATAWADAPRWVLGSNPIAVIGAESDGAIDLSTSQIGTMLSDGRVAAMSMQPPQLYLFGADGSQPELLGRGGEGPGEYRFLSALLTLGGDTIAGYDLMNRRALRFLPDGEILDPVQFPIDASPIPPLLVGRLADGTWVFQVVNPIEAPPEGTTGVYRLPAPVLAWRSGDEAFDTLFLSSGPMLVQGEVSMGANSMTMGRGIGYGANSYVGAADDLVWSTTSERFEINGHDATGALKRVIRVTLPERPVSESDREKFRQMMREQLEAVRSMAPAELIESEIAKIDEMVFSDTHAAIGQMIVDRLGRIWATPNLPMVDSTATWGVFSPDGAILGSVTIPAGTLFAASEDRVVVRIEDEATGLVRLEVLGIQRDQ